MYPVMIAAVYNLDIPSSERRALLMSFDLLPLDADDLISLLVNPFIGSYEDDDGNPVRTPYPGEVERCC